MYKKVQDQGSIEPLGRARQIYSRVISRALANGTTSAAYYATIDVPATDALAEIALQLGQRALIGRVCMDEPRTCPAYYRDEGSDATIDKTKSCIEYCRKLDPQGRRIRPVVTPRFAPSCQRETLRRLGDLVIQDNKDRVRERQDIGTRSSSRRRCSPSPILSRQLMIQTHLSETKSEIGLVRSLFSSSSSPENPSSSSTSPHPTFSTLSYASLYDTFNLLTPSTILAHAVHLSNSEIELIRQRQSKIAHCPASNTALGSGHCNVRKLLDAGIDVGLGTDVSGGFSVGVLDAVRQAYLVSRTVRYHAEEAGEDVPDRRGGDDGRMRKTMVNEKNINTDNNTTDISATIESRSSASSFPEPLSISELLYLATVGGAKVIGMDGQLGTFEPGMLWDVQEIDLFAGTGTDDSLTITTTNDDNTSNVATTAIAAAAPFPTAPSPIDIFGWESWEERVAKWVWSGDDRNVRRVWVGGRLVHRK